MSQRNGDRSRFQIERKRKLVRRQRVQELVLALDLGRVKVGPGAAGEQRGPTPRATTSGGKS
jgi:hypothetical protein